MLAAQMVGAHTAAMEYLNRALAPGQQVEVVDRYINWAARLMRVFNERKPARRPLHGPALRRAEQAADTVSSARDEERALQVSRWAEHRPENA
jgi:hypothetical protein